jgi:hypothetical protein
VHSSFVKKRHLKGRRESDLGLSLAYLELYLAIGTVFRNFEHLRVHPLDIGPKDLEFDDYFGLWFPPNQHKFAVTQDA